MFQRHNILLIFLWVTGLSLSNKVNQSPPALLVKSNDRVQFSCSHKISGYYMILWYQQQEDNDLKLIGYTSNTYSTIEEVYEKTFNITGDGAKEAFLHIPKVRAADTAVYFCAATLPTGTYNEPAYFGNGTKLVVLDPAIDVTPPTVKVLSPPDKEICKRRKKVTLVCVVTEFYPDHIKVYWQQNGVNITRGNQTDDRAMQNEGTRKYSITSRLRIPLKKWYNLRNSFTCLTSFYNGKNYTTYNSDPIYGVEGGGLQKGDVISRSQWAKLSYVTLFAKSALYGMFIFIVVWKLKGSGAKK